MVFRLTFHLLNGIVQGIWNLRGFLRAGGSPYEAFLRLSWPCSSRSSYRLPSSLQPLTLRALPNGVATLFCSKTTASMKTTSLAIRPIPSPAGQPCTKRLFSQAPVQAPARCLSSTSVLGSTPLRQPLLSMLSLISRLQEQFQIRRTHSP